MVTASPQRIDGTLDFSGRTGFALKPVLPEGLAVRRLVLDGLEEIDLPAMMTVFDLSMENTRITEFPPGLNTHGTLNANGCRQLKKLPKNLKAFDLRLRDCVSLEALPEGLDVHYLDVSGCTNLTRFPKTGKRMGGKITARGCTRLRSLPKWVELLTQLDLQGCTAFEKLPEGLLVTEWIDIAGTRITKLPKSMKGVEVRWRGVVIPAEIALHPEKITTEMILNEQNAEVRRVMIERMGYERFVKALDPTVIHEDYDAGGPRRLLWFELPHPQLGWWRDEPIVLVTYLCPSTGRQYVTRVPPAMQTCHQAVAWISGFDDPDLYHPIAEA